MRIEVDGYPVSYGDFDCPLQGDVGNCQAIPHCPSNHCPICEDDENGNFVQRPPDDCPLRSGDLVVTLRR